MATAAFLTTISPGPGDGSGASPTSRGVSALLSHAAWFVGAGILGCFQMELMGRNNVLEILEQK